MRAIGVRIADGREVRAPIVISVAGAAATFGGLLRPATAAEFHLLDGLRGLEPSMGHLCLYIGMEGPASGGDVVASNLWCHPSLDFDANVARAIDDPNAPFPLLFISFPSAKDPTFAARHPGRATAEIVVPAPFAWFEPWADTRWKNRGATYDAFKARLTERRRARRFRSGDGVGEIDSPSHRRTVTRKSPLSAAQIKESRWNVMRTKMLVVGATVTVLASATIRANMQLTASSRCGNGAPGMGNGGTAQRESGFSTHV